MTNRPTRTHSQTQTLEIFRHHRTFGAAAGGDRPRAAGARPVPGRSVSTSKAALETTHALRVPSRHLLARSGHVRLGWFGPVTHSGSLSKTLRRALTPDAVQELLRIFGGMTRGAKLD